MTTELRELLDTAADDATPVDLAHRALDGARRRRQQRFAVVGAVAAVTALVAGAVVLGPLQQNSDEPRPQDVASEGLAPLPGEMPILDEKIPTLLEGTMEAASVAYIWDSQLMLVDATTAKVRVWYGIADPGLDTGGLDAGALEPYQVRLSPDGRAALVAMRYESSERLLGIRLVLLDLESAEPTLVEDLQLTDAFAESTWLEYNLMTWTPSSQAVYCVCIGAGGTDPELGIWTIEPDVEPSSGYRVRRVSPLAPAQISAGAAGLAVQLEPGGDWTLIKDESVGTSLVQGEAFALSEGRSDEGAYVDGGQMGLVRFDGTGEDVVPLGERPVGPVVSLQASGTGYILVSRPPNAASAEPLIPDELYARLVTENAEPQQLTFFPSGASSPSFAAEASFAAEVDTVQ